MQSLRLAGVLLLIGLSVSPLGCAALQQQITRRSEKCGSLCEQAREARAQGWPDQAELLLDEAIRHRPKKDVETRRQLAQAMWEAGRHSEALVELSELVQLHPDDAKLRTQQATLLWNHQNAKAAARAADVALRLDPQSIDALYVKARSDAASGDYEEAVASYVRLLQLAPDRLDARFELAEVHIQRGHPDQACPLLRDALPTEPATCEQRADVEWRLGLTYAAAQRWTDAANSLGRAIEHRDASDRDWQCLAAAKSLAGQDTVGVRAMAQLASARQSDQEPATVWTELRDRVARRGASGGSSDDSRTAGTIRDGVVRADFSRSALAGESRSGGTLH
jgi:tetratricopeptide (TPR) repeat protein